MDSLPREAPPTQEEYHLPRNELAGHVPLGRFPKDSGENSSRLAEIQKAAKKVPGPGKYMKVDDWGPTGGVMSRVKTGKFGKGNRFVGDAKEMVKKRGPVPGPGHYENKDFSIKGQNGVSNALSSKYLERRDVLTVFIRKDLLEFRIV